MDPFSQAALGAVVGQLAGHRTLGYRAAICGAAAGALPDVDVLFSLGGDFVDQLVMHRGITHSLFFAPVAGPLLGWCIWRWRRQKSPDENPAREQRAWILVCTLAMLSHPLLDLLTPFGTQLLLPFSNARFAVNAMPIIDPVYTLLLAMGLLLAWLPALRRRWPAERTALLTLLLSTAYLGYGWLQNQRAEDAASAQLAAAGIEVEQLAAFPTLLQVHLRRVVARSPTLDRVGFYSTWAPCEIVWHARPRAPESAYQAFLRTREGRVFQWFGMGWVHYRLASGPDGRFLLASDLRYGFSDDPSASVFTVRTRIDDQGRPTGPIVAGRSTPDGAEHVLNRLLTNTYAPACRLFSGGRLHHNGGQPPGVGET